MPASDLTTFVNAIPTAHEGHVIGPQYHNTMRAAVSAIATQLGGSDSGASTLIASIPPVFSPVSEDATTRWLPREGQSIRPTTPNANGWLHLQLPDNARIIDLTVVGSKTLATTPVNFDLRVFLRRKSLESLQNSPNLINIALRAVDGEPFKAKGVITAIGTADSSLEELQTIDNSRYLYFIVAKMDNAPIELQLEFHAFLVTYNFG